MPGAPEHPGPAARPRRLFGLRALLLRGAPGEPRSGGGAGFTLLELAISLAIISVLLALVLPALASARVQSKREKCADNMRRLGRVWWTYLEDHRRQFPFVPVQPGWHYGGVRFSTVDDRPFLDPQRPLTPYLPAEGASGELFHCPADTGITDETMAVGTGRRTAFRAFGTSYYANPRLLVAGLSGVEEGDRGLRVDEIATVPSRLVVMGNPIWNEIRERTGRDADWHGDPERGNLLFLDGSVKFMKIPDSRRAGPAVFEPKLKDARWLEIERQTGPSERPGPGDARGR